MKSSAKMTVIYITISNRAKQKKTWISSISRYDYKVVVFIMLPLRYGSVPTNIILITLLRLSMHPMV